MTRGRARWTVAYVRAMVRDYEERVRVPARYLIVPPSSERSARKVAEQVGLQLEVSRRIRQDQGFICGVIPGTDAASLLMKRRRQ